jgi:hypothetical protein
VYDAIAISVLGMAEKNVLGIAIPKKNVDIDGLLGRSFPRRARTQNTANTQEAIIFIRDVVKGIEKGLM